MKKRICIISMVIAFCLTLSAGVWAEDGANPGAAKVIVNKENNSITFVYDDVAQQLKDEWEKLHSFSDVAQNAWYQLYISHLTQLGIINGISETSFAPSQDVTRAEFAKMITLAAGADLSNYSGVSLFSDVSADSWYAPSMQWANENGIIKGQTETTFCPNDNITREEAAVMLYRYAQFEESKILTEGSDDAKFQTTDFVDENRISSWALKAASELSEAKILIGNENREFNPSNNILRSEAAKMLSAYIVFNTKPTLYINSTILDYIEETPVDESIPVDDGEDDSFHGTLSEVSDNNAATSGGESALSWKKNNHSTLTGYAFTILLNDKEGATGVEQLQGVGGKYSTTAQTYVKDGSIFPDNNEKDNESFRGHFFRSYDGKNKDGGTDPTAFTRFNNHYYWALTYYSWG